MKTHILIKRVLLETLAPILLSTSHAQQAGLTHRDWPICVFSDMSHEFTFMYDWWIRDYLPSGEYALTSNLATICEDSLSGYQIMMVEMHSSTVGFTDGELETVERFVRLGGGLFIIGNGQLWAKNNTGMGQEFPLNQLASKFGFEFLPFRAEPSQLSVNDKHQIMQGVAEVGSAMSGAGTLRWPSEAHIIISDSTGRAIAAERAYGAGKIVIVAHHALLSPVHAGKPLKNEKLIQNIFKWLADGTKPFLTMRAEKVPERFLPEHLMTVGSVKYYYSEGVRDRAEYIQSRFPTIFSALDSITGVKPIFEFTIVLLASGGGGYSGGNEIGLGCLAKESYLVRVIAHELTHSWVLPGPLPHYFNESWASLIGIRIATKLGYAKDAMEERQYFQKAFEAAETNGKNLDLGNVPRSEAGIPSYTGKGMWIAEQLESRYGADFLTRFFQIKRKQWNKNDQLSMREFVQLLSEVVENDLRSYFKSIGTTF